MSLLIDKYKKEIYREKILRLSFVFISLVSGTVFIFIIFMLPSYFALIFATNDTFLRLDAQKKNIELQDINFFEEVTRKINKRADLYVANESRRYQLSTLLIRISNITGNDIQLKSIDLKSDGGLFVFVLRGVASTRDSFLSYTQKLKSAPEFSSVRSPISNLLREFDAPFEVEVFIKKDAYFYVANQ